MIASAPAAVWARSSSSLPRISANCSRTLNTGSEINRPKFDFELAGAVALSPDGPAVQGYQRAHQVQADAEPSVGARVGLDEKPEEAGEELGPLTPQLLDP